MFSRQLSRVLMSARVQYVHDVKLIKAASPLSVFRHVSSVRPPPPPITTSHLAQGSQQVHSAARVQDPAVVTDVLLNDDRAMLTVTIDDSDDLTFPYVWLRDSCQCPKCWHPSTKSRLLMMETLQTNVKPTNAQVDNGQLAVLWSDGHESVYEAPWLVDRQFSRSDSKRRLKKNWIKPKYWGSELQDSVPRTSFEQLMSDDHALYSWLCSMEETGIHFITDAPGEGTCTKIASRVAYLRLHIYGLEFHVKSKPDPTNLAFTNASLGLHTDAPFYYYVPGVQMLHCLVQAGTEGGDNVFSDGFNVAEQMRQSAPEHFAALTQFPVDFYDVGSEPLGDYHLRTRKPTINLSENGEIEQINYNNQVRDTELNLPLDKVIPYYKAMKAYNDLLYEDKNKIFFKLKPGEVVCFHNYRVLHGRLGYQMAEGGERHLNGGYIDWDEMHSMRRVLQDKLGL